MVRSTAPPGARSALIRADRLAAVAALIALLTVVAVAGAPSAAAQPSLVAAPNGTVDGQVRLVVEVPAAPLRPEAFSASVDGVPQPTRAEPVLSDRLAMALVVDASADMAQRLPAGLTGAANIVLAAPPSARSTLVVDGTSPTVTAPWPSEQEAVLHGLSAVQAGGTRSTAAALDLAVAQLPATATDPRLVLLYTGAPDAGGEQAPAIVDRLRAAGALLAVVEVRDPAAGQAGQGFWAAVADGTGGVAVAAAPTDVVGAFDRVASALDRRCLLTFPVPARLPASVVVRVATGGAPLVGEVTVPPPPDTGGLGAGVVVIVAAVALVVVAVAVLLLVRRRAARPGAAAHGEAPVWSVPPRLDRGSTVPRCWPSWRRSCVRAARSGCVPRTTAAGSA